MPKERVIGRVRRMLRVRVKVMGRVRGMLRVRVQVIGYRVKGGAWTEDYIGRGRVT